MSISPKAPLRTALCVASMAGLFAACSEASPRSTESPGGEDSVTQPGQDNADVSQPAEPKAAWDLKKVSNIERLGTLLTRQRDLLGKSGFFLAPQPPPPKTAAQSGSPGRRATHLFHIYERNDYIAFPSFVTADLAIDATHAYFNAVMRELEQDWLVAKLDSSLAALMQEAEHVRARAKTKVGRAAAQRAVAYWGVALHLLRAHAKDDAPDVEEVAMAYVDPEMEEEARKGPARTKPRRALSAGYLPKAVRRDVTRTVDVIQAASGTLPSPIVRAPLDLTQMRPRGHYNRNGVLQRYFRAMSWLGMAQFKIGGESDDVEGIALLARSWLGSKPGRDGMKQVLEITTFFAGGPDAADLDAAATRLQKIQHGAGRMGADALAKANLLKKLRTALADLPAPRVPANSPFVPQTQVRVMGRRAFEDTVAMRELLGPLMAMVANAREEVVLPRTMGALGAAAVLGSDMARDEIIAAAHADDHAAVMAAVARGRDAIAKVAADRWDDDAYHGTLTALRPLLADVPAAVPRLLRTPAWRRRALQAFAAGWAELRHDTILYGVQLGVECDAPDPDPPPGWVEPVPAVYRGLGDMVRELERRFKSAGVDIKGPSENENPYYQPLSQKASMVLHFLDFLRDVSEQELEGTPLSKEQRQTITLIGGRVEWILISLANTDLLSSRDQDMAVVADVMTYRPSGKVVEVGVAHPDLVYAIIPSDKGPVIARGAVMSYREFLAPQTRRMTDEEWRKDLAAGKAPERPAWVEPIYAPAIPSIALKGEGVGRCGPMSGANIEL